MELIKDQEKLCYTHTGQSFICSGGSATRGEVVMGWIKAHSTIKTKMAEWNLYEYYNHYDILIRDYVATTLSKIEKVIMNGNGWCSKYISDMMDKSFRKSSSIMITESKNDYMHPKRNISGTLYLT